MKPSDFEVNQAWIAFKINSRPLKTGEGDFNVFVIIDAASTFILGQAFAPAGEESPDESEVEPIFLEGWSHHQRWPERLILPGRHSPDNSFAKVATQHGITVVDMTEKELRPILSEPRKAFREFLSR